MWCLLHRPKFQLFQLFQGLDVLLRELGMTLSSSSKAVGTNHYNVVVGKLSSGSNSGSYKAACLLLMTICCNRTARMQPITSSAVYNSAAIGAMWHS